MNNIVRVIILILFVELVAMTFFVYAEPVTLAWDSNTEPDLGGYNVYTKNHVNEDWRLVTEIYENDLVDPLHPETTIWGLSTSLVYHFVVTAFNDAVESGYSNEVIWEYQPPEPEPEPDKKKKSGGGGGGCFIGSLQ